MPNNFTLIRTTDTNAGPVALRQIDNELREHFGIAPDPENYYHKWVHTIGMSLTCGYSLDTIVKDCKEAIEEHSRLANPDGLSYWDTKLKIAQYLNQHFVSNAWAEIGRREGK
jgi:hypothetical protein